MSDIKLAIIDGTGPFSNAKYALEMRNSFCSQMHRQLFAASRYERGPSDDGYRMNERGERAAQYLLNAGNGDAGRIMIAGYSRGGSAAIMTAEVLKRQNVKVDALFLFDPVARHLSRGGVVVPDNVNAVFIARRKLDPSMVAKYDHTIGPVWHLVAHNPMRVFFGTTASKYAGSGECKQSYLLGSHGAMGGVGWKHVSEDSNCQIQVAGFMNAAFKNLGLPIQLTSSPPANVP